MSLPFKRPKYVSCSLSNVVIFVAVSGDVVVWEVGTQCYGKRGIAPRWLGMRSFCEGPLECSLLENGELFYPPDRTVWLPYLELKDWEGLKSKFVPLSECDCEMGRGVREHIVEMKRKWGIE